LESNIDMTILVTGASGQLGRCIVDLLLQGGRCSVIAGTRTPDSVASLVTLGAEVRKLDFDDDASSMAALEGVDRVLMISTNTLSPAGRRVAQHQAMVRAAAAARVEHLVYTSFARSDSGSPLSLCADHIETERALTASGLRFTALRHTIYAESLVNRLPSVVKAGEVAGLPGGGGIAYVSREDCARVAVAVVTSERPPEGAVEVTGPEVVDDAHWVELAAEATGQAIRHVELNPEALRERMLAGGLSPRRADWRLGVDTLVAEGFLAFVTGTVERLTGSAPRSLREVLMAATRAT
jgi:NAD(P)H dehydrogenase (quinone)